MKPTMTLRDSAHESPLVCAASVSDGTVLHTSNCIIVESHAGLSWGIQAIERKLPGSEPSWGLIQLRGLEEGTDQEMVRILQGISRHRCGTRDVFPSTCSKKARSSRSHASRNGRRQACNILRTSAILTHVPFVEKPVGTISARPVREELSGSRYTVADSCASIVRSGLGIANTACRPLLFAWDKNHHPNILIGIFLPPIGIGTIGGWHVCKRHTACCSAK